MNKINHYISTYQKDYTWPYVSSICRTQLPTKPIVKTCTCINSQQIRKELWDENVEKCLNWNRLGRPMGQLLKPRICPKIERVLKTDITQFDQPINICLKEEYSGLYNTLKKSFPKETQMDINRMKTTYQADYSDPAAARMIQRDMTLTVFDTNDQRLQCSMPMKITIEADCPSYYCFPSSTYNEDTNVWKRNHKQKTGIKREKKCEDVKRRQISLPSWKSEYQDSINKIGHAIMRAKLHRAKKKSLPVQYQYCTTSS